MNYYNIVQQQQQQQQTTKPPPIKPSFVVVHMETWPCNEDDDARTTIIINVVVGGTVCTMGITRNKTSIINHHHHLLPLPLPSPTTKQQKHPSSGGFIDKDDCYTGGTQQVLNLVIYSHPWILIYQFGGADLVSCLPGNKHLRLLDAQPMTKTTITTTTETTTTKTEQYYDQYWDDWLQGT